jgi:hypothetical protein
MVSLVSSLFVPYLNVECSYKIMLKLLDELDVSIFILFKSLLFWRNLF